MKKLFYLSLVLTFLSVLPEANAQIKFGVKGGVSLSTLQFNDVVGENYTLSSTPKNKSVGGLGGVFVKMQIPGFVYVQPEVMIASYVNSMALKINETSNLLKANTLLLDIPVMIGINIWIFHLNAGPVYSLKLSDKIADNKFNLAVSGKKSQFGYQLGGGIHYKWLVLDVRYGDYFKKSQYEIKHSGRIKNMTATKDHYINITAGIKF